ncbi:Tubulin-specific chaperone C [Colletotrichum sp. SAR 10_77]|nr:Tubulin-specific chaperone C [Colletotrichum sp. SAR 10_77]
MAPEVIQPVAYGGGLPVTRMQIDPKEKFYRHFQDEVAGLQDQIDGLGSVSQVGGERQDAIDHILAGISALSHEVADASDYVPSYDQRSYAQAVKALTDKLNETTTKLAPRSRFQFKSRGKAAATSDLSAPKNDPRLVVGASLADPLPASRGGPVMAPESRAAAAETDDGLGELPSFPHKNYNEEMARPSTTKVRKPSFSTAKDIAIYGQDGLHIILPSSASRATSSGRLTDLRGCIVDMSLALSGTTSFANLALRDDTPEDPVKNQWDQVDDFKWLKSEPSPNWSVLPEEERLAEEIWTKTVPGEKGKDLHDILKAVGIPKH